MALALGRQNRSGAPRQRALRPMVRCNDMRCGLSTPVAAAASGTGWESSGEGKGLNY
jgi:hypothetical protein